METQNASTVSPVASLWSPPPGPLLVSEGWVRAMSDSQTAAEIPQSAAPGGKSTASTACEVNYCTRGRKMVQDLESFLRSELTRPREGRRIMFRSAWRNSTVPATPVTPAEE
jgi:hypothetical protein